MASAEADFILCSLDLQVFIDGYLQEKYCFAYETGPTCIYIAGSIKANVFPKPYYMANSQVDLMPIYYYIGLQHFGIKNLA